MDKKEFPGKPAPPQRALGSSPAQRQGATDVVVEVQACAPEAWLSRVLAKSS